MRLVAGHRGLGLTGIKSSAGIPECYGIHGIYESGAVDSQLSSSGEKPETKLNLPGHAAQMETQKLSSIEQGGIRVYRPLLGFSKSRLIATAQEERIPWFEDTSNKDRTLTRRNAIRFLFESHKLPNALTKPALLAMSKRIETEQSALNEAAEWWFNQCKVIDFEWRAGTLRIQFPKNLQQLGLSPEKATAEVHPKKAQAIALLLIRRIVTLVSPDENVQLSSLHGTVERVFPYLFSHETTTPNQTSFTVAGVNFQAFPPTTGRVLLGYNAHSSTTHLDDVGWFLSRQQYSSNINKRPIIELSSSVPASAESSWSPWVLYDGRYWIRVRNPSSLTLHLRPFQKEDLQGFRKSLSTSQQKTLERTLKALAPGDVRWTLPAITELRAHDTERLLCLPTLDMCVPEAQLQWEVRYKKVDISHLELR